MQPVFSLLLTLVPRPGESDAACFAKLTAAAEAWAKADQLTTPDGPGPAVFHRPVIDAAHDLLTLDAAYPVSAGGVRYTVRFALARTRLGLQAHVTVRAAAAAVAGGPVRYEAFRPAIVAELLKVAGGLVHGQPVPGAVRRLDGHVVGGFVDDVLLAPHRALPVVVLSPVPDTGRPLTDPERVLDAVYGTAEVVALGQTATTFALTNALSARAGSLDTGKKWSCFHGAARIYWPGLVECNDDFRRHPLFFPANYPAGPDADDALPRDIARRIAQASALRFTDAPLVKTARGVLENRERAAVEKRIAELSAGVEQGKELARLVAAERDRVRTLADDLALTQLELAEVREQLAFEKEQWAHVEAEITAARADADACRADADRYRRLALANLRRVSDAVQLAAAEFPDTLVFLDDARKSAADSVYQQPQKVFDLFAALDRVMQTIRAHGSAGEELHAVLQRAGYEYKPHISDTTAGKYGAEYTFVYAGSRRLFENHVTLGKSFDPRECLSVHWLRDETRKQFVVGWCGKHRTNTRS